MSIFGIILGMTLNKWLNLYQTKLNTNNYKTHLKVSYPQTYVTSVWFFFHKWYFDYIYNYYIGYTILQYSYNVFYKLIDKGFIEILSLQGLSTLSYKLSSQVSRSQLGTIYNLSSFLFLGLISLFVILLAV